MYLVYHMYLIYLMYHLKPLTKSLKTVKKWDFSLCTICTSCTSSTLCTSYTLSTLSTLCHSTKKVLLTGFPAHPAHFPKKWLLTGCGRGVLIYISSQPGSFTTRSPQMPATHCPLQYIFIFYLFKYICYTRKYIIDLPLDWLYAHNYYDYFYMSFYAWSLQCTKLPKQDTQILFITSHF